jgi:sugar phosphate isomerase/epimerase
MLPLAAFPKGFFFALVEKRMSLFEWIDLAGRLGLDGVELYPRFFESLEPTYLRRILEALERRGLRMPMMCNSPDFTDPDPAARAEEVRKTRELLRVTRDLGGRWCRVLSGQNRPGLDPDEAMGWVVGSLRELVLAAEESGVVLVIENHYKDGLWEYPEFAQSRARYLAILEAVPQLMVQYDPSNAIIAREDQYELLDCVLPRVATMQASDRWLDGETLRHGVIGRGLNDYDRIFRTLARAGYRGWVSIEDGEAPAVDEGLENLRESAAYLRAKIAEHFR